MRGVTGQEHADLHASANALGRLGDATSPANAFAAALPLGGLAGRGGWLRCLSLKQAGRPEGRPSLIAAEGTDRLIDGGPLFPRLGRPRAFRASTRIAALARLERTAARFILA